MASSSALLSPPAPKPSGSNVDDGDVEMEYEEIEEEIEVEEEVEARVEAKASEEGDDDGFGEDLTPVREENKENDANQILELKEHEHIQPGPVPHGLSVSKPISGERTSGDNDQKACFNRGEANHVERNPFIRDVNAALVKGDASREQVNAIVSVRAETNHTAVEAVYNTRQISPKLHVQQIRFRDPSSIAEYGRENKKLMIACEFHAKGWCIKGNSCRFLHIKNRLDAAVKKSEVLGTEVAASSSACIAPRQSGANPKLNSETEKLVLHENDILQSASLQSGKRSFGHNLYLDRYSNHAAPLAKDSSTEGNSAYCVKFSGSSVTSHNNHQNSRMTAFGTTSEEMNDKKSDIVRNDLRSANLRYSRSRQPLSFGSSSWNIDALGIHNLLQVGQEHRTSRSESENLLNNDFRDTGPAKYKIKLSSYDWVPSVPFRPSHAVTRNLLLKESLYDPIHDSIERTSVRDGTVKFSYSDQGSSVKNVKVQSNGSQEEEKLLNSVPVGDTVEENLLSSSCDNKLKFDEPRHNTELKVEESSTNDETGADLKKDGYMPTDSKAFRYFQAALIEFVKELVKPTWQKGLLSKDAHKVIVKKAVDKVLSTFQPDQIPNTAESVKLYLSTFEPKLAKLVEGYTIKYGKSWDC